MSEPSFTAELEVVIGSQVKKFRLEPGTFCQIGRSEENTMVLDDNQVSRRHAMVRCEPNGEFYLADLGSRNGTWVNQRRVTALVALRPGDRIGIGGFEILFRGPCMTDQPQQMAMAETWVEIAQRLVTVLVVDIRDFTSMSTRLPEARLTEIISAFARGVGMVLAEQGAWAQKHTGDGVMAIWLHPTDRPPARDLVPVFTALEGIFGIAAGLQTTYHLDAPVRVGGGINTGMACVGNMGSDASADYTALSDAVTLAFRLESATKAIGCDIALGQQTYNLLADVPGTAVLFEPHTVSLKGYPEPKPVFTARQACLPGLVERLRRQPPDSSGRAGDTIFGRGAKS